MAKEYTVKEFAELCGDIANGKVDKLCTDVVRAVGDSFIKDVVKETPEHKGGYVFPEKFNYKGSLGKKSTTGLRKGWEANKNFNISKGSRVYTAVISNKAKSSYTSPITGRSRTDYYAHYVDEGFTIKGGYKPFLDAKVKTMYKEGAKFTDKGIKSTERKLDNLVMTEFDKWFNEVF